MNDINSRLQLEKLPTVILKFIYGGDKKLTVIEIVSDNARFSEVSLGYSQISKVVLFGKIATGFKPLNAFFKKTQLRSLTRCLNTPLILQVFNASAHLVSIGVFFINIRNISLLSLLVVVCRKNVM